MRCTRYRGCEGDRVHFTICVAPDTGKAIETEHGFHGFPWQIPLTEVGIKHGFPRFPWQIFTERLFYFANSEISDTFAILNQKVYPSRALFQPWPKRLLPTKPHAHRQPKQHTSPDGGIGRRAGLKHQWSNPCRFDPGSGY